MYTLTQLRTSCLFSLRSSFFHFYDLPVIFIPNSTQILGFFSKKILLSVTIFWTAFIPNTLLFVIPNTMYVFYMSGNRNEHLLGQTVMKSWCEMSLSPWIKTHVCRKMNVRRINSHTQTIRLTELDEKRE